MRQHGDFEGWISFFLDAVTSQALDAATRAEALLGILGQFRQRLKAARVRGGAVELAEQLIANPFLTTSRASKLLGVSYQGASYAIQRLVQAGIVNEQGQLGPARLYLAREVLDILEEPVATTS